MLLPQILKRLFYPRRLAAGRAEPEERHPGADRSAARSGREVLEETVAREDEEARKESARQGPSLVGGLAS